MVTDKKPRRRSIVLTVLAVMFVIFFVLPIIISLFDGADYGNVALIPINGVITTDGSSYLGSSTLSSQDIISYIEDAKDNSFVDVIVLEINSPGGSAVGSDEIATAVKQAEKPVVAMIREYGASGGYWIASSADYVFANRMAITGSIGVISSFLEFSGLMNEYGVGYERMVSGELKDMGTPYKKLTDKERAVMQRKMDHIHDIFISEVADNRGMSKDVVKKIATGEFYLGDEALSLGLIDALGGKDELESYIKKTYDIEKIDYVAYEKELGLLDILTGVFNDFSFKIGEGIGSSLVKGSDNMFKI